VREVEPGEREITGTAHVTKTLRKSSPILPRSASSCNPVACFAFSQNSGDEPHHAGTRSGARCSKAVITLSLEVILRNRHLGKKISRDYAPASTNLQDLLLSLTRHTCSNLLGLLCLS
jgi:hypothetical protein